MKKNILLRLLLACTFILFLSAYTNQFSPLFASFLPEGRTLDEAHDSGVIDWSGPTSYISLWHRDALCPTGCNESVTRISNGGTLSGILAGDVTYFEVMVAATHNSSAGNAVLTACSASDTMDLYIGSGTGAPGLVSFPLSVPSGCTTWSLSASGGYVDFRSVDANYVSPPVLTDTPIPTDIPVNTDTPLPTAIPVNTDTPLPTVGTPATSTNTPTDIVVATDTPIPTHTSTSTSTSPVFSSNTPTFTFTSTSGVHSHTHTPVVPTAILQKTSTSSSGSVNNSNKSNSSVESVQATPTASAGKTNSVSIIKPTSTITRRPITAALKTSTVVPANYSETVAQVCSATSTSSGTGAAVSKILGLLAAAGAAIGLGATAKTIQQTIASWKQNGSGKNTIKVPRPCTRTATVKEWVTRTIKTIVEVYKYITRTIVEAVARFINRVRQVIDTITHSEWVASTRRVLKTVFETVIEKVPVLKWLAKLVSYIYKTVIKPILKWITETIRTLKTWVEKVIRYITERIQDGWNYITRTIVEKVKEFIEKFEIVGSWVTHTITVPDIEWVEIPVPGVVSNLLSANTLKIIGGIAGTALMAGAAITSCTSAVTSTPTEDARVLTLVCGKTTQIAMNATQTAQAASPTPTLTPTISLPRWLQQVNNSDDLITYYPNLLALNEWINKYRMELREANLPTDPNYWQNKFNQDILVYANAYGIPPYLLKGIIHVESISALSPENDDAFGLVQFTVPGLDNPFSNSPNSNQYIEWAYEYAYKNGLVLGAVLPQYSPNMDDPTKPIYSDYYGYYKSLTETQRDKLRIEAQKLFDGICSRAEVTMGKCFVENSPRTIEGTWSIDLAAQTLSANQKQIVALIGHDVWESIPQEDQWEILSASYNGGVYCVRDSISLAQKAYGQVNSWEQIKGKLQNNCIAPQDTARYPDIVVCYASGTGDQSCE